MPSALRVRPLLCHWQNCHWQTSCCAELCENQACRSFCLVVVSGNWKNLFFSWIDHPHRCHNSDFCILFTYEDMQHVYDRVYLCKIKYTCRSTTFQVVSHKGCDYQSVWVVSTPGTPKLTSFKWMEMVQQPFLAHLKIWVHIQLIENHP